MLRKPSVSQALIYRFAPGLLAACPDATVDLLITTRPPLDPRRLLPALLRYGEVGASPPMQQHVLRYISFAIDQLQCQDRCVNK